MWGKYSFGHYIVIFDGTGDRLGRVCGWAVGYEMRWYRVFK